MADALLSPAVGGSFWIISGSLIAYSAKKISQEKDAGKTPLMGVMAAFVFAAQMINFAIPGTGSSGHIGGGLLLAVLLGPYRAFIALASVLVIQALFFADGGVLALGCNMFNLAAFPAFIAYPLIFRPLLGSSRNPVRMAIASIIAADVGLMLGAFSVVVQTVSSGMTDLPFVTFALFMLPIHLAIGIIEGLVTWGVLAFIARTEPALLDSSSQTAKPRFAIAAFAAGCIILAGVVSWFASTNPDGLVWSIAKIIGSVPVRNADHGIHAWLAAMQQRLAILPDYSFKTTRVANGGDPASGFQTSIAGLTGSVLVLASAIAAGFVIRKRMPKPKSLA